MPRPASLRLGADQVMVGMPGLSKVSSLDVLASVCTHPKPKPQPSGRRPVRTLNSSNVTPAMPMNPRLSVSPSLSGSTPPSSTTTTTRTPPLSPSTSGTSSSFATIPSEDILCYDGPCFTIAQQLLLLLDGTEDTLGLRAGTRAVCCSLRPLPLAVREPDAGPGPRAKPRPKEFHRMGMLGEGAGGRVYAVNFRPHGKSTKHNFAEKVIELLPPESEMEGQRVAKALRAELLYVRLQMDPEYVVQAYEAYLRDNQISIIMEFMDFGSLSHVLSTYCENEPLPSDITAAVLYQVLRGLRFLHGGGHDGNGATGKQVWIHRDIKPANILINRHGCVKISDFGCSAMMSRSDDHRRSYPGTEAYKAPEFYDRGAEGTAMVSTKADVWALGLVGFHCAMGAFPWPTVPWTRVFQEMQRISQTGVFTPGPECVGGWDALDSRLKSMLLRCLTVQPAARPTADQLLQDDLFADLTPEIATSRVASWLKERVKAFKHKRAKAGPPSR